MPEDKATRTTRAARLMNGLKDILVDILPWTIRLSASL